MENTYMEALCDGKENLICLIKNEKNLCANLSRVDNTGSTVSLMGRDSYTCKDAIGVLLNPDMTFNPMILKSF